MGRPAMRDRRYAESRCSASARGAHLATVRSDGRRRRRPSEGWRPLARLRQTLVQLEGHENTIAILRVRTERPALPETNAAIERLRRLERRMPARLEEQLPVAALTGHLNDVIQQGPSRALPATTCRRPHRFDLA